MLSEICVGQELSHNLWLELRLEVWFFSGGFPLGKQQFPSKWMTKYKTRECFRYTGILCGSSFVFTRLLPLGMYSGCQPVLWLYLSILYNSFWSSCRIHHLQHFPGVWFAIGYFRSIGFQPWPPWPWLFAWCCCSVLEAHKGERIDSGARPQSLGK